MSINGGSDPSHRPAPWIPMQYPAAAAAMVMPHHMIPAPPPQQFVPPPHYMPYGAAHHQFQNQHVQAPQLPQHHQVAGSNINNGGNNGENKTIWVGDLHQWMDENYLHSSFASTGEVVTLT